MKREMFPLKKSHLYPMGSKLIFFSFLLIVYCQLRRYQIKRDQDRNCEKIRCCLY